MDKDEMDRYERDGEDRFDNFGGYDHSEEYEDDYEFIEVYDDEYDGYQANQVGRLDPNDTTYTFIITNANAQDEDVVLFGANEAIQPPAGVTILVAESSHNEVRQESLANPFSIIGMKMKVSNTAQFSNVLMLYERTSSGRVTSHVKQPLTYQSPQNQVDTLIHAIDFHFEVTGKSSLRFKVKPGTVTFTFNVSSRTNIGNVLQGKSVSEVNNAPQATGLPQFDMVRVPSAGGRKEPGKRVVRARKEAAGDRMRGRSGGRKQSRFPRLGRKNRG